MRRLSLSVLAVAVLPLASHAQAPAAASCRPVEQQAGDSLVIPIEIENNHVFVAVCVANRALTFILDTGAGQSFLDLNTAKDLGFSLGAGFSAGGAGPGTIRGAQLSGASATLAGVPFTQRIGAALDLSRMSAREGHRMDGILGADFIASRVLALDYAGAQLRLYDRAKFRYGGTGTAVPLTFPSGHPHIEAEIRLTDGETVRGQFVVDVGSSAGLALAKPFVDDHDLRTRVGPTLKRPGGVGVGGQTMALFGRVAELHIGSVAFENVVASLHGDSAGVFSERGSWVGNIGGEILRRFTVYFDYAARRMILEPNATI
ncbi:MAG: aspartyl protease family protein, partial [bacterium]